MIFDLTANTNRRKLMVLDPSYPKDVSTTVIKGNTTSATFSVVITEPGSPDEYTYQWYVNGSAVSGANSPSYTRTGLSATATYTVYCEITNKAGTVKSRVATLKVTQYYTPVLNSSYPANATVVKGNSVTAKVAIATAGVPASYTYQWYKNGSKVSGATSSSYTFTPTAVGTTTLYCVVTNSAGSVTSRTATITATVNLLSSSYSWKSAASTYGAVSVTSSAITFSGTVFHSGEQMAYTESSVKLTDYSTLKCTVKYTNEPTESGWSPRTLGMYICSSIPASAGAGINSVKVASVSFTVNSTDTTYSISLSAISGSYYVVFWGVGSATISKVWLE